VGVEKTNISTTGPLNRRSLGFARDDKGKDDASMECGYWYKRLPYGIALVGSAAVPFVIPSEAEGSAVQRTRLGNVFSTGGESLFLENA
jgi:hypothetical protein